MFEQTTLVALLVSGCTTYAAWTLMPASMRRAVAQGLLKLPLPERAKHWLRRQLVVASGCGGCGGCGSPTKKRKPSRTASARFHAYIDR